MGIMLVRLRLSPEQIKHAILSAAEDTLSSDNLEAIKRNLPTAEETDRLTASDTKVDKLPTPDRFLWVMSSIPSATKVLDSLLFRIRIESTVQEARADMGVMRAAIDELRGSERFRSVLHVS